jgi:hypothetical protein
MLDHEYKKNVRFKSRLRKYKQRAENTLLNAFSVGGVSAMILTKTKLVLALILLMTFSGFANAQNAELRATVESLQGTAQALTGEEPTQEDLRTGSLVRPWDSVSVDEKSKLLLSWKNGLLGSIGELSDMSLASEETQGQEVPSIQVIDGIFRFISQPQHIAFFSVNTPLVSIYPATDQPVDFSVEVYTPESTLVTVFSGQVMIRKLNGGETVVPACHNILIEEGKNTSDIVAIQPDDIGRLVEATTIPGTIGVNLNECGMPATAEAVPVEPPQTAIAPDYYIEDWAATDEYPFFDVSVLPPASPEADWVAVIPGIGRFVIDIPFVVDPAIVNIYVQEVFFQRGVFFCRDYLAGLRLRHRELTRLMYLARMTGDINLLRQTQRRLNDLTIRTNWAARSVNRFDQRLAALQHQRGNLSGRLPRGADLSGIISASLNSPANSATDRKFQDTLRSDVNVQTRLANMAGQELGHLRQRIANEPNLGKRLAMRQELSRIQGDVTSGKALIPRNQGQVDTLVKQLVKTQDLDKRGQLENQLAGQLKRYETPESGEFGAKELAALKRDLNKIPNQQGREVFQKRAAALEQSINARTQAESHVDQTQKNIQDLSKQVATERNPEKRNELIGRLNELSKSLSVVGPGSLQFLEKLKRGQPPAVQTEPRAITGTPPQIQKPLELQPLERARQQQQLEQRQTEKSQKELLKQRARPQELPQRQQERQKQLNTRQQELQKQQVRQQELRQQQMLERQRQLQQKPLQTRPQDLQQRQLEGGKKLDTRQQELQQQTRQQQLQQRRLEGVKTPQKGQQDLHQQQLFEKRRDAEKRALDLRRQQTQEQDLRQRQLEQQKQQQALERERASREQTVRQQQMKEQQQQQMKEQQHQQQIRQQQLQQDQARQRQLQEQQVHQQQLQQQQMRQQQLQQQLQQKHTPPAGPLHVPKKLEDERKPK